MKIAEALRILELDTLPKSEKEVSVAYKRLAKKCHPDSGGSEEAFQELGAAVDYVLRALALVDIAVEKNKKRSKEFDALAEKRAKMRAEMLKRRAEEDRKRNIKATWAISIILVLHCTCWYRYANKAAIYTLDGRERTCRAYGYDN